MKRLSKQRVFLAWAQKDTLPVFDPSLFEPKAAEEEAVWGGRVLIGDVFRVAKQTFKKKVSTSDLLSLEMHLFNLKVG